MRLVAMLFAMGILFSMNAASAENLSIELQPDAENSASPQMGDHLSFHTVIRNDGSKPIDGLIAWISLVQIDKGKEQPVDLEDWSAHKAVTAASLAPSQTLETDWPVRLIQAGNYRVVVSAVGRTSVGLVASPFADFSVRQKPVVESQRVLPVAFGIPLLIAGAMLWRRRR
ncbi:MAG: hypothetical protein ACYC1L_05655 [Alphaproteobacteria bacterium]